MRVPVKTPCTAAILAAVLMQLAAPRVGAAQDGNGEAEKARRRAAAVARADSIRATLVQPPPDRGFTTDDLVRVPFRLFGAALTVAALPPLALYALVKETGVDRKVADAYEALEAVDLHVSPDFIGSRSWPALVVRWDGLDPFFVEGGASLRGYTLARAGLSFGDTLRGAEVAGTHHVMKELHTWGAGMDAPYEARSDYAHTRRVVEAGLWTPLADHVRLRLDAGWEEDDVDRGFDDARPDLQDQPFRDELFGVTEETSYWRGGGELDVDWSRAETLQLTGFRAVGRYDVFRGAGDTDSDFHRATADARLYVPLTGRHLVAARVLAQDHLAEEGGGVPFHRLAMLGDDDGLRGYTSRRFRERALAAASLEWRYEVWFHPGDAQYRIDGFVFVDRGGVGPSLDDIEAFETTPGLGLRFVQGGITWVETYVAWGGDKSPRFDIELGATF